MTSKTVLVKAPNGRNFSVEFLKNDEQTDFTSFKEAFYKICAKDDDLCSIIQNKEHHRLSFRRFDELFNCQVEITDFDEIQHASIVELFITTSAVLNVSVEYTDDTNQSTVFSSDVNVMKDLSTDTHIPQKTTEKSCTRNKRLRVSTKFLHIFSILHQHLYFFFFLIVDYASKVKN